MAFGTERGTLGDLRIVTRTWGYGDAAEYQADLLAPTSAASNFAPIVHLSHQDADEIEAFGRVMIEVGREVRHQYCGEDCTCPPSGEDEQEVTTEEFGELSDQLDEAQAAIKRVRELCENPSAWGYIDGPSADDVFAALDGKGGEW